MNRLGARELNKFRNKKVGFVFQFYHLLDELNVLENVYLPVMAGKSMFGLVFMQKMGEKPCQRAS